MDSVNNQQFYRHVQTSDKALPANRHFVPEQVNKIAENYEKQFAQFLLKEFHKSIPKGDESSTAGDIYQGWMIDKQADTIAKNDKGLGLKDLILDEIYPRKYRNEVAYEGFKQAQAAKAIQARNAYKNVTKYSQDSVDMKANSPATTTTRKGALNE